MIVIEGRNVNELWKQGFDILDWCGRLCDTRNGTALVSDTPVMSVYQSPTERVLFDPVRDANPFFHLMESLWMLAGRRDAAFLNRYVGDFGDRFGETDGNIHGAYGHRWREAFGFSDQLEDVIHKLCANLNDRQAVIQMWDASDRNNDLTGDWKDRPCNTHLYCRIRGGVLDLTVCCRSNDIVWGAYGANAVHFSMLQEYLAGRIGVGVGTMYQFSNNWHGYTQVLNKVRPSESHLDPYAVADMHPMPIASRWEEWDADLTRFMAWHDNVLWASNTGCEVDAHDLYSRETYANAWFAEVAASVAIANYRWKTKEKHSALNWARNIAAPDWAAACSSWILRRMK